MRSTIRKNKAVSPVIATILLIVIAVATAIVVYTWAMAFVGSATTATGPAGQMKVDDYVIYDNSQASVFVRNIGTTDLNITGTYIDGRALEYKDGTCTAGQFNVTVGGTSTTWLSPGQAANVTFYAPSDINLKDGKAHTFTVVCTDGTTVTCSLRKR